MALNDNAIALAILIVCPGNKGFDCLHVDFSDSGQLSKLQYPVALQFLGSRFVSHI